MQPASTNGGGGSTNGTPNREVGRATRSGQRACGAATAASLAYDPAMRLYQLTGAAAARLAS